MIAIASTVLLAALACQDDAPRLIPGDATASSWNLSGPADAENGDELFIRARRVVRRWDESRKLFIETLSDNGILRTAVTVAGKKFEGSLRAGIPGRYGATLATDEKILYSEKLALGPIEPQFARTADQVKSMLEASDKALEFLDEIERILLRQIPNDEKHRDDFLRRVGAQARKADEALDHCDLSASAVLLREVYFHIRNVQVWEEKSLPPPGQNDPPRNKKKIFMDMELTIELLRKKLGSLPQVISSEIKVSTTLILERLVAQAGDSEKRRESARAAARAASKLAEGAPVSDKDLVRVLDKAADRSSDPMETRDELRKTGLALVVQ
jgi:hypothetical protein